MKNEAIRSLDDYVAAIEQENAALKESYHQLFMAAAYVCHHSYHKDAPIGTRDIALDNLREVLKHRIATQ
jgi:hypothetical protein